MPTSATSGIFRSASWKSKVRRRAPPTTRPSCIPSQVEDYNGLIGEPRWTANAQVRLKRGDWTFAWSTNFIGGEDNIGYQEEDGLITISYAGPSTQITSVKDIYTHDFSVRYKGDDYEVTVGATNITDEQPPQISYNVAGHGAPRYDSADQPVLQPDPGAYGLRVAEPQVLILFRIG